MKTFRFLPEARRELLEQISYYAATQKGLGSRFERAVAEAVRRAVANPEHGAPRLKGTRRVLVQGFPFSVIYRSSEQEILIVAVAAGRRRPEYWAARIS